MAGGGGRADAFVVFHVVEMPGVVGRVEGVEHGGAIGVRGPEGRRTRSGGHGPEDSRG